MDTLGFLHGILDGRQGQGLQVIHIRIQGLSQDFPIPHQQQGRGFGGNTDGFGGCGFPVGGLGNDRDLHRLDHGLGSQGAAGGDGGVGFAAFGKGPGSTDLLVLIYGPEGKLQGCPAVQGAGIHRADFGSGLDLVVDGGVQEGSIAFCNVDLIPVCFCAAVIDVFQLDTRKKSIFIYACYAYRNCHAGQAAAALKGISPDPRHALWNRDAGQTAATEKGRLFDARHTLRDPHAGQAAAVGKGIPPDARHALRKRDVGQATAARKGKIPNSRHALRYRDAGQAAAAGKGRIFDARQALRERDAGQAATAGKSPFPDV